MGTLVHRVSLKVTNQTTNGLREEGERGGGEEGRREGKGGRGVCGHNTASGKSVEVSAKMYSTFSEGTMM